METIQAFFYADPNGYPPIINSARLLAAAGFRLEIFCRQTPHTRRVSLPPGVAVTNIPARFSGAKREYLHFAREALRHTRGGAALYIGHDMRGLLPARLAASIHRRPLVYHCHELVTNSQPIATLGTRAVRGFQQRFARTADLVIVPDEDRAEILRHDLKLRQPPLVAANSPLESAARAKELLRGSLAARGFAFDKILFRQSLLDTPHAIEATIRSLPYWKNPRWGFVVMGPGDAGYISTLRSLAEELKVADRFEALPPVSYDEVACYTSGADIGHALYRPVDANHCYNATASNKVAEYMAAGIPLLVSDRPRLRALVREYRIGAAADEDSPESIADAVNLLLGDDALRRAAGEAARRAYEQVFCYELQFKAAQDAIRELAARPPAK